MFFIKIGTKAQRTLAVTETLQDSISSIRDLLMIVLAYAENYNAEAEFSQKARQIKSKRLIEFMREESGIMRSSILSNEISQKVVAEEKAIQARNAEKNCP